MEFEWDPAKNDSNEVKHGISFLDALELFDRLRMHIRGSHHHRLWGTAIQGHRKIRWAPLYSHIHGQRWSPSI